MEKSGKSARAVRVLPSLEWETIEGTKPLFMYYMNELIFVCIFECRS